MIDLRRFFLRNRKKLSVFSTILAAALILGAVNSPAIVGSPVNCLYIASREVKKLLLSVLTQPGETKTHSKL